MLKVYFISRVKTSCPRLLINKEKVGMQDRFARFLGLRQGMNFDPKNSGLARDVAWIGDCDSGCELLADKLGWGVSNILQSFFPNKNKLKNK